MKKHIPNIITCCNLLCGCMATYVAFMSVSKPGPYYLIVAFCFILGGAVFDFFDGFTARLLGVSSPIGKELDSLADVITFGLSPAAIVFDVLCWILPEAYAWAAAVALLIAPFSALRLAKFNLDTRQTMGFIGLPTPANALFWGGLALTLKQHCTWCEENAVLVSILLVVGVLLSCWLLVCEVPMFALKFHDFSWKNNRLRFSFILASAAIIVLTQWMGLAIVVVLYIVLSILQSLRPQKVKSEE